MCLTTITVTTVVVIATAQAPVFGVLLFGSHPRLASGLLTLSAVSDFLVLVPDLFRSPRTFSERVLTFLKFTICLIVPEVKAVSCSLYGGFNYLIIKVKLSFATSCGAPLLSSLLGLLEAG
jgi:hypothetical protein